MSEILVVEDIPRQRTQIEGTLLQAGHHVEVASGGNEALAGLNHVNSPEAARRAFPAEVVTGNHSGGQKVMELRQAAGGNELWLHRRPNYGGRRYLGRMGPDFKTRESELVLSFQSSERGFPFSFYL